MKNILKSTAAMAIIACFLWSTAFAGVKIGLQFMSPLQFAGLRFFISGLLIMLIFGNFKKYLNEIFKNIRFILIIAFTQTFLMYSFFYTGLNMVPGSLAAMVIGSGPLFAALVAHFAMHNDKMTIKKTSGILLGIVGIVIINWGRQSKGIAGGKELLGVLLLVINNLIGGIYNVLVMKNKRKIPSLVLSSASLWIGGLFLFLVSIPIEGFQLNQKFPTEFYLSLGWLSFLSAAAFSIWFVLLKRPGVKISYLNSWKFIIPVFGATLSWILLPDETPDGYAIIGMIVVAGSLLVMNHEIISRLFKKSISK